MKKLLLFVAAAALTVSLNSCSSDDSSSSVGGTITAKFDGVAKTFNNVIVDEETFGTGEDAYTELTVTGLIGSSTEEVITFYLDKGDVGADAIYGFDYDKGDAGYNNIGGLNSAVQTNSNRKITGSFSGTLAGSGDTAVTITEGTFNLSY